MTRSFLQECELALVLQGCREASWSGPGQDPEAVLAKPLQCGAGGLQHAVLPGQPLPHLQVCPASGLVATGVCCLVATGVCCLVATGAWCLVDTGVWWLRVSCGYRCLVATGVWFLVSSGYILLLQVPGGALQWWSQALCHTAGPGCSLLYFMLIAII